MNVEWLELGNLLKSVNSGLNPRNNFVLNEDGASNFYVTVKEITTGKIRFDDKTDKVTDAALKVIQNRSKLEIGDVLVSGIGTIGKVAIVDIPCDNWNCSESVLLLKAKTDKILPKYLMYILSGERVQCIWERESVGSTLKGIRKAALIKLLIPVPPIDEQRKIVDKLDTFTTLIEKLGEEIELRKKQYEYYLNDVLNNDEWELLSLGQLGVFTRGTGIQKSDFVEEGKPCIHYGQVHTKFGISTDKVVSYIPKEQFDRSKKAKYSDIILATTSEDVDAVCKPVAWLGAGEVAVSTDAFIFSHKCNPIFMVHQFLTNRYFAYKASHATGAKVIRISDTAMTKYEIYLPNMEIQNEIGRKLDAFTSLITKLEEERDLRQKQYEYYREKLLTFE